VIRSPAAVLGGLSAIQEEFIGALLGLSGLRIASLQSRAQGTPCRPEDRNKPERRMDVTPRAKNTAICVAPFRAIALAGLLMTAWSGQLAAEPMQSVEYHFTRCNAAMPLPDGTTVCDYEPFYLACLDEYVVGEYHIVSNYKDFVTPAGTAQVRDNWRVTSMLFGVLTDRAWYAVGVSPAGVTVGKGETWTATGSLVYKPLADGPTWHEQFVTKFNRTPDGKVVVEFHRENTGCLSARR
jgi:hypothetical protein